MSEPEFYVWRRGLHANLLNDARYRAVAERVVMEMFDMAAGLVKAEDYKDASGNLNPAVDICVRVHGVEVK